GFDFILHATGMDEAALEAVVERKVPIVPALTFQANMVDFGARIGTSPDLIALFEREITESAPTLAAAHKAGVPLLTGSEAGFALVPYGDWHYREMEVFVKYFGLSPLEAIECGTRKSAFGMRMMGEIGAVLPGYKADLIVVNGRVEDDLTLLGDPANITRVMIDGVDKDLSEPPPRKPIPGWRLAQIGGVRLTRDLAFGPPAAPAGLHVEELH
ncbi:MAG: amidohydrolase family protein, partial [Rhodobacteraceae bacterium]|nr:amidohydrolase family protein [Paracoccaceae bacterium]